MTESVVGEGMRNKEHEPLERNLHRKALVIGGGIAGIQAALDIADAGFSVVLVERKPAIGGHMAQLAQSFPTMDLAAHILTPLLKKVGHHQNVKLLTSSEVVGVKGSLGNFHVQIRMNPRCVDTRKCDLCKGHERAQCVEVCPVTVSSEFDEGLTLRKAIYISFPQAVPSAYIVDRDVCISCGKCAQPDVCGPGAVTLTDEEEVVEEDVGVVIVATGYELCSQENIGEYGLDECNDVITSLQFERLLSPEGPTAGVPRRLSDGEIPKKIAFIHCVRSKDERHLPGCSNICWAYLAKQAILFKNLVPDGEVYSFYVDAKAKGTNYEPLIKMAQEEAMVNYVRAEVSRIYEHDGKVKIHGVDTQRGKGVEMEADMVVLALPMVPSPSIKDLSSQIGIKADEYGLLRENDQKLLSVESTTPGIFVVGCAQTPMDTQRAMAKANEAASKALEILS